MASVRRLAGKLGLLRPVWWAYASYLRLTKPTGLHARALVTRSGTQEVLLIRHTYRPGWFFPGGGIEGGETACQAAEREAWEEAGIKSSGESSFVGLYLRMDHGRSDHVALYRIDDWQREPIDSMEIAEAAFFPADALPDDIEPGTRRRVEEINGLRGSDLYW